MVGTGTVRVKSKFGKEASKLDGIPPPSSFSLSSGITAMVNKISQEHQNWYIETKMK